MREGGGVLLVQKFLRYKVDGSYGYSCNEYKVVYQFILNLSILSWIKSRGTAVLIQAVT